MTVFAQIGTPFFINIPESAYASDEYVSSPQNWDFVQDERGIVYVANSSGILEYDGHQWRMIRNSEKKRLLDLARDSTGQLYAGGRNELGFLEPDSTGRLTFRSLLAQLPDSLRQFGQIQSVLATAAGVYFIAPNHVFLWKEEGFQTWQSEARLRRGFMINGQIWIQQDQVGLVRPVDSGLELLPGSAAVNSIEVRAIMPVAAQKGKWLLASKVKGLFAWSEGGRLQPIETPQLKRFPRLLILDAIALSNGEIAIAAYGAGIFILTASGELITHIRRRDGFLDDNVIALRTDNSQGIWAGLGKGISRIQYPAPFTSMGSSYRLKGIPNCVARFEGDLYIGSTSGLFRYVPEKRPAVLDTIPGEEIRLGVFDLMPVQNELLVATPNGVYQYRKKRFKRITTERSSLLFPAPHWPEHILIAGKSGLSIFQYLGGEWKPYAVLSDIDEQITGIYQTGDGDLWVCHGEVSHFRFPDGPSADAMRTIVPVAGDLPAALQETHEIDGKIWFTSAQGMYRYDPATRRIIPDSSLIRFGPQQTRLPVNLLTAVAEGDLWFSSGKYRWLARKDDAGQYETVQEAMKPIGGQQVWDIYVDRDQVFWISANEGIFRFDPGKRKSASSPFHALVRSVSLPGDSVVFWGESDHLTEKRNRRQQRQAFPYEGSDLQFGFSATSYGFADRTYFSYRLKGYETEWSPWRNGVFTERYTNLREGEYQFEVKARNLYGEVSEEGQYAFRVMPPWYRTWWAQLLFLFLIFGVAVGIIQYVSYLQNKKSLRRQRELEAKLEQERLVSEQLQRLDHLKDEFLANTSHELRTPLNGIIGIAEGIIDQKEISQNDLLRQNLRMIIASGKRLNNLVSDLLDFSQLKTENLELRQRPVDLHALADVIINICAPLVKGKELELINAVPEDISPVDADEDRLEQILLNLFGNAIKFTQQGRIQIDAEPADSVMEIRVSDTGIGIPEEQQVAIFQSFEQGDGSIARKYGGTGLGLSITQRLVELHGGTIRVDSNPGAGSVFNFTLPLAPEAVPEMAEKRELLNRLRVGESLGSPDGVPSVQPTSGTIHILIVDDEPINQQVLKNHLADAQYHLVSALNGDEALEILNGPQRFDLVLLDIMMPRMSGYEVCKRIREKFLPSELPVIMITAKNQVKDLVEGFSYGANDYITKPFSKSEFLARIKMHLNLFSINKATARFVPYEFLRSLGKESILDVELGDLAEQTVTVLFIDIRSYTTLSEQMTPEDNFRFLNAYLGRIGPLISQNRGFVNQYYGDGIMALFLEAPEDAIIASINIRLRLAQYNRERIESGRIPIATGTGIHTGPLIMGILGDEMHMDAGVVSDTVNTASRMEGLTKIFGVPIIVSQDSIDLLRHKEQYNYRFLGNVMVKGKVEAIGIYEFFDGEAAEKVELLVNTRPQFEAGIKAYFAKSFEEAAQIFETILSQNPEDRPAAYYLGQSRRYRMEGVPEDWTGVELIGRK